MRSPLAPLGSLLNKLVRPPEHVRQANVDDITWNEIVGPGVGRRARPLRLRQGVLTVRVATSSWAQQLSMLRDDLRRRLGERGYVINDVRFSVGPVQAPRRLVGAPIFIPYRRSVPLPPRLERVIGLVPDGALRLILARAASANLTWQRAITVDHPMQANLPGLLPPRPPARPPRLDEPARLPGGAARSHPGVWLAPAATLAALMANLQGKTLFITGASRGIGKAIGLRAARDGANVVIAAKTSDPNPKLPGTIHSAAEEMIAAGGQALPLQVDIRDEQQVAAAVAKAVERFGGIDILVNNASAISLTGVLDTPMKRFDLMHQINARGTFACSQACLPHLLKASNPHILTLSPPLNFEPRWFGPHTAYSLAKFGMSLCTLGMAEEFRSAGVAVNSLWPRTVIATAAVQNLLGGDEVMRQSRTPEILADAAYLIFTTPSRELTGRFLVDDDFLREHGVTDFDKYLSTPGTTPLPDFFV